MDRKDKSRGLKHFKDKRKYKDNTTKNPKYVPPKQLPKLETNWDRYDRVEDSLTDCGPSTDFAILANAPVTKGNHFQFKNDKIVVEETKQDLFTFDLSTLNDSILAIPFYKRVQIDESYFSEAQLKSMKKEAEESLEKYVKKYIKSDNLKPSDVHVISHKVQEIALDKAMLLTETEAKEKHNDDHQISYVPITKDKKSNEDKGENEEASKKVLNKNLSEEDLDKWLDEVLAD